MATSASASLSPAEHATQLRRAGSRARSARRSNGTTSSYTAPRLRYSGASLGYQLASVIAGGPAPLIAAWLFGTFHSGYAIAFYILACAVLSLIATALMPDYTGRKIDEEYDRPLARAA